jgi:multidrug efflux pump subunit AcrA (membrane-fusion protein)
MMEKIDMRKWTIYIVIASLFLGGAGWLIMKRQSAQSAASDQPTETAIVQRGDLAVNIDAIGSLASPTEFALAFSTAGKVSGILVAEGQTVKKGDLLARLEESFQAEYDFQALFSDAGIAQSELALINAQSALDYAVGDLAYLIGLDAYYWEKQLGQAEEMLIALNQDSNANVDQETAAEEKLEVARGWRDYFLELNIKELESVKYKEYDVPQMPSRRHILQNHGLVPRQRSYHFVYVKVKDSDLSLVYANLENAKVGLQDAEAALEIVKSGPSALQAPLTTRGPEMARLEQTRQKMENTRLTSLADGVVTTLFFQAGEFANPGAPVIALSDVSVLEAEVNLDETDVVRIVMGMSVTVTVDAFPGMKLTGQVIEIAPTANVQSGVVLYPVTVRLDPTDLPLRSGMTVNVTFPIQERKDTLLVPFRAVETEGAQAYVTRVTTSGNERVPVTLGLITDTQVEILSGLKEGDVVTVYANPVQDTELMKNPMFGGGQ